MKNEMVKLMNLYHAIYFVFLVIFGDCSMVHACRNSAFTII